MKIQALQLQTCLQPMKPITENQYCMKNQSRPILKNQAPTKVSVHSLIDNLVCALVPLAVSKRSFLLNAVEQDVMVDTQETAFTYILSNLITGAVNCTDNGCIRIEAYSADGHTCINVKNNSSYYYSAVSEILGPVHSVAQQLGGSISIDNLKCKGTIVSFTIFQPIPPRPITTKFRRGPDKQAEHIPA
jgi:hypothetical protein